MLFSRSKMLKCQQFWHFNIYELENFHAKLSEHEKGFIISGSDLCPSGLQFFSRPCFFL